MTSKVYPYGSVEVTVAVGDKIAIAAYGSGGGAKIYYQNTYPNHPQGWTLQTTVDNSETTLGTFSQVRKVRIDAGADGALYNTGTAPEITVNSSGNQTVSGDSVVFTGANGAVLLGARMTRSTVSNGGTVTDAQHRGSILYQDASGGNVTMTTRTAAQLAAAFPQLAVGDAVFQFMSSNHATNTSTISGGTDVTLIGSGAVTRTGGVFLLVKTAAATFDLVRVG